MATESGASEDGPLDVLGNEDKIIKQASTSPPGRSARDRVGLWLAMRAVEPSITDREIAGRMGISHGYLRQLIYKARRGGWLEFTDPLHQMEYDIVPMAVDNLSELLNSKDRRATIETAKGVLFPLYRDYKGISETAQTILALKIETAEPTSELKAITGQIVGRPRLLEGVIDAQP